MGEVVGIDSSVFIYLLERKDAYRAVAKKVLKDIENGKKEGILSAVGMTEILTGPKKCGDQKKAAEYTEILTNFPNLTIGGLHEYGIQMAAEFQARHNIRTPDAIHLATTLDYGGRVFYTNDKNLKKVKGIEIRLLSEMA